MSEFFQSDNNDEDLEEKRPPIFKTWRRMYLAVLGNLILLIAIFYFLTKALS